jgi:hypothetical protein
MGLTQQAKLQRAFSARGMALAQARQLSDDAQEQIAELIGDDGKPVAGFRDQFDAIWADFLAGAKAVVDPEDE